MAPWNASFKGWAKSQLGHHSSQSMEELAVFLSLGKRFNNFIKYGISSFWQLKSGMVSKPKHFSQSLRGYQSTIINPFRSHANDKPSGSHHHIHPRSWNRFSATTRRLSTNISSHAIELSSSFRPPSSHNTALCLPILVRYPAFGSC